MGADYGAVGERPQRLVGSSSKSQESLCDTPAARPHQVMAWARLRQEGTEPLVPFALAPIKGFERTPICLHGAAADAQEPLLLLDED